MVRHDRNDENDTIISPPKIPASKKDQGIEKIAAAKRMLMVFAIIPMFSKEKNLGL